MNVTSKEVDAPRAITGDTPLFRDVAGIVAESDLFNLQRASLTQINAEIRTADSLELLKRCCRDIHLLAEYMLVQGVTPDQITQIISTLNDQVISRTLDLELRMRNIEGIRVSWIALGSEGRFEQTFSTDQDNGIPSYTWSKAIDNASEIFGVGNTNLPQNTALPSIYGGLTWDRSLSFFDRTHRASFSYVYQLPFMTEQQGILGRIVGGWQLSGLYRWTSGFPMSVNNGAAWPTNWPTSGKPTSGSARNASAWPPRRTSTVPGSGN